MIEEVEVEKLHLSVDFNAALLKCFQFIFDFLGVGLFFLFNSEIEHIAHLHTPRAIICLTYLEPFLADPFLQFRH